MNTKYIEKCLSCNTNKARPFHSCPYLSDVKGDIRKLCNCCHECELECGNNI